LIISDNDSGEGTGSTNVVVDNLPPSVTFLPQKMEPVYNQYINQPQRILTDASALDT
jgi:hypothetical protein